MISKIFEDNKPLQRIWIYNNYAIAFAMILVKVEILETGLRVDGLEKNVFEAEVLIEDCFGNFKVKVVQFQHSLKKLEELGKGSLLEIDEDVKKQMKKFKCQAGGSHLYAYHKQIQSELKNKGIFKQLVNRILLTPEQVLTLICFDLISKLELSLDCYIGIQSYGLYLNGKTNIMEKCYQIILHKLNNYSIRYLRTEASGRYSQAQINLLKKSLIQNNICCLYNQIVQTLYRNIPLLKQYVQRTRKIHGKFLAVICKDQQQQTINQILSSFEKSNKSNTLTKLSFQPSDKQQSLINTSDSQHSSSHHSQCISVITRSISRITFKAIQKFTSYRRIISQLNYCYDSDIRIQQQKTDNTYHYNLAFIESQYTFSIQQQLDCFIQNISQRKIKAYIGPAVDKKQLLRDIYDIVDNCQEFREVVVDNLWLFNNQLKINMIVSRDSIFNIVLMTLEKMLSEKAEMDIKFVEIWIDDSK